MGRTILIILMALTLAETVFCQTMVVKEVRVAAQEVIFRDRETGEELVVRVGDVVEGWAVQRVTETDLTISYLGEDNVLYTTDLPLRSRAAVHMLHP